MILLTLLIKNSYQSGDQSEDHCPSQNFKKTSEMILYYPSEVIVKFHKLRSLKYIKQLSEGSRDIDIIHYKELGYHMYHHNSFKYMSTIEDKYNKAFIGLYHPDENVRLKALSSVSGIDYIRSALLISGILVLLSGIILILNFLFYSRSPISKDDREQGIVFLITLSCR